MVASILATALAQKSVRYRHSIGLDLLGGISRVTDVTANSGRERAWSYDGGKAEVRLVDGTVYVKGNRAALRGSYALSDLGLTRDEARRYAGRWISIPRGNKLYAGLAGGLTLGSLVREVAPSPGRLKLVRKKLGRTRLVDIVTVGSGRFGGDSTLTARARGDRPLVSTSDFIGYGNSDWGSFSRWNKPLHIPAPARSTPIAAVLRG